MKKLLLTATIASISTLSLSVLIANLEQSHCKMDNNKIEFPEQPVGGTMNQNQSYVVELTSENAQLAITRAPTILVIDFYAEWCGPCKTLKPIFEELATEFRDRYMFAKINVDNCRQIAQDYGIESLPTTIIFSNGQVVEKIIGLISKETLLEKIEEALNGPQDLSTFNQEQLNNKLFASLQNRASTDQIKRLLDAGAQVNSLGANDLTPLILAIVVNAVSGSDVSELIKLLLSYGASTEFKDTQKGTTMQASELVNAMGQNYKRMAENCDKIAKVLTTHSEKKASGCTADSCTL